MSVNDMARFHAIKDQDLDDPLATFMAQMTVVGDQTVAQAIRNERSGHGRGLRELGYIEVAEVLGY